MKTEEAHTAFFLEFRTGQR